MKTFILLSVLTLGLTAQAQSTCQGEAQMIAKVDRLKSDALTTCKVMVKDISFYRESIICPLDIEDVLSEGIEIGLKNGHDCEYDSDTISGVVVRKASGQLGIE